MSNQIVEAPESITEKNAEQLANSWINTLQCNQDLIIDLSKTKTINGVGYRVLLRAFMLAKIKKLDFCVCNPNDNIKKILEDYGLGGIIAPYFEEKGRSH